MRDQPPVLAPTAEADNRLCANCGRPLRSGRDADLCRGCRAEVDDPEDFFSIQRRLARERRALEREVGIPPGSRVAWWTFHAGALNRDWEGYEIRMAGIPISGDEWRPGMPSWQFGQFLHHAWGRWVLCPGTPSYVEGRWLPEEGREAISLRGLELPQTQKQAERALLGRQVLKRYDASAGRPRGRTTLTREEFLDQYAEARRVCIDEGYPVTDNNLVRFMTVSKATLVRYRTNWLPQDITENS